MPIYRDPLDRRRRYDVLRSALWTERQSGFDSHWRELADVFMPRRIRFTTSDRNRGDKRNQRIIDSTGRFAARTLSAGMHAGLTSPARPWMKLTTPDPSLAKIGAVKLWLHEVSSRMLTIFATSNLYNVLPLVYLDMGIFGTAAMSIVPDSRDLFRCYSYPIGSFALGQDARGLATTFVRDYQLTVRQIVEEFCVQPNGRDIDWTPVTQRIHDYWDRGDYETPIEVTWITKPNEYENRKRLESKYLPWASCTFETGSSEPKFLRERGFKTFPVMAPRWDITGEDTYGTDCPGMTVLGDNNQLQIMQRRKGQLLEKAVNPPMKGPGVLRNQKTSLLPGDITYVDVREGMQGLAPIHEVRLEGFQHLSQDIGEVQYRIQRGFYEDLFLMLARSDDRDSTGQKTAREVEERHEEKWLGIGPVLERTNDELLDPIVDRVYQLMDDAGLIPPAPEQLRGVNLKAEYISILAQAQKLVGVVGQDRLLATTGSIVASMPEFGPIVRHKLNMPRIIDNYSDMLGTDPEIIVSTEDAEANLAKEQQAQQAQADAEHAKTLAEAAQTAGQTPMGGDSLLSRVAQTAAQQSVAPSGAVPAGQVL